MPSMAEARQLREALSALQWNIVSTMPRGWWMAAGGVDRNCRSCSLASATTVTRGTEQHVEGHDAQELSTRRILRVPRTMVGESRTE